MNKYYTRACNFYYGSASKKYIKKKKSIPLNGYSDISFDKIEIIDRKETKTINFKDINKLPNIQKNKVKKSNPIERSFIFSNVKNFPINGIELLIFSELIIDNKGKIDAIEKNSKAPLRIKKKIRK